MVQSSSCQQEHVQAGCAHAFSTLALHVSCGLPVQGVHHQKQNVVLFGAAGIAGRPRLHALVSRSDPYPVQTRTYACMGSLPHAAAACPAIGMLQQRLASAAQAHCTPACAHPHTAILHI